LTYYRYAEYLLRFGGKMGKSKFDDRFFESTRGRIVLLLRNSGKTVNDLAGALSLTDNAVRAHLLSLERDRLVEPGGTIKGFRKPHYVYRLTDEARHRFPKPYDTLFNRLFDALKVKVRPSTLNEVLCDTGRRLAPVNTNKAGDDLQTRMETSVRILEDLGGAARIVTDDSQTMIKSESCPFSDVVAEHPEVCRIAESMIEEIVGKPVKELCDRTASPKCCFVIETA
jgi:predicted ArsR family transcriptional regulator